MKTMTLYEANALVRETIELSLDGQYWVEAELSEVRESRGHCYMELVQFEQDKDGSTQRSYQRSTPIARASAKCWASAWAMLRPHFERVTGQRLHAGLKVLLQVYPQFHEAYGFSWIVTDINPEFTMGDMMRKRQEIIRQLQEEGVYDLQKELIFPMFAQRIAVISSATAAGYGDFCHQLRENEYGFVFRTELFAAVMQGEQIEESLIAALNRINEHANDFDCVVIFRGGGATADLSGFDTLALAENVANFPLPVITGLGHERDECVLDMISHLRVKTPTAAAAFLIEHLKEVNDRLEEAETAIYNKVSNRIRFERLKIERLAGIIPRLPRQRLEDARHGLLLSEGRLRTIAEGMLKDSQYRLLMAGNRLKTATEHLMEKKVFQLEHLRVQLEAHDPQLLLKRGYSITLHKGKAVRDPNQLQGGDEIETRLQKGTIHSVVK